MPHIKAVFVEGFLDERILVNNKTMIRRALHQQFPKYPMDAIAFIPEPITSRIAMMTENLLPLEFVIDIGKQPEPIDDSHSDALRDKIIELAPDLVNINFGVWVREMPSNGFSEHKP